MDDIAKLVKEFKQEVREKAIDEFAEKMKERVTIVFDNGQEYINAKWIEQIAEQLKGEK